MAQKRGSSKGGGDGDAPEHPTSDAPETGRALVRGTTFFAKALEYVVVDGLAMFEGDIVLGTPEEVERENEILTAELSGELAAGVRLTGAQFRWPDCRVAYTIDASLPNQNRVTDAIAHWEANTRFRFVVRTTEANYVTFRPGGGCSSSVGMRGGQQFINLSGTCTTGNTIHEIGHTVGLWHEQSREDRDSFVTVTWAKIQSGFESNFNQHIADGDDVGAYDYGSIMHYPRDAFSTDGTDTITPTNPASAAIGQRTALSPGDIAAANAMCPPKVLKEVAKDVLDDQATIKETVKDIRFETRKELIADTAKEIAKDRVKEVAYDPPWTLIERAQPTLPGQQVVNPFARISRLLANLPFAMATDHQAPDAAVAAQAAAAIPALDARLTEIADALTQLDANRAELQAQYDETAALLSDALDAHDAARG
jgi:hypothetical protein